jgi:UTP--glucose-1-phosphate uridylyltransferase
MTRPLRKAVFPVAGLGTRFLPATKASPKEMLPIVDKPLIQYAVEEAVEAGVDTLIFITGRNKRAIEDHFDKAYELETELEKAGKTKMLKVVRDTVPDEIDVVYIRQREAKGLGDAVSHAKSVVGNEPFAIILADDLIKGNGRGVLSQMIQRFEAHSSSVLGVERVPQDETKSYGIVSVKDGDGRVHEVESIVEKPKPEEAPSNLAVVGRYILTPTIFPLLEKTKPGAGGEIQLTDAIGDLLLSEPVVAYEFAGKRYDCGSKLGYLAATVEFALGHDELGAEFSTYLDNLLREQAPS